jgi:hypothetical protein
VRRLGLRHLVRRLGLHRVDHVGELDPVLDEEHRDVVADQIEVAFGRVEPGREATHVAHRVGRAARADHGREPDEHRRADRRIVQERGARQLGDRLVDLEVAVRTRPTGVHDTLRNALVIEVRELLPEVEVLQERGAAHAGLQGVVRVRDRQPLVRGQHRALRLIAEGRERGDLFGAVLRRLGPFRGHRIERLLRHRARRGWMLGRLEWVLGS